VVFDTDQADRNHRLAGCLFHIDGQQGDEREKSAHGSVSQAGVQGWAALVRHTSGCPAQVS